MEHPNDAKPSQANEANPEDWPISETDRWSRLIVEAAPNAMVIIDRERRIVLANKAAERLFGYTRHELAGQRIELLLPEPFREQHAEHVSRFFAEPKDRAMGAGRDLLGRCKNGSEIPIEIGLNPIETSRGHFVLACVIDITERRNAEDRFRLVVEAAASALLMIDRLQKIMLVNRKAEELFGYAREDLLGRRIEELVPERFRSEHPNHVLRFMADPKARAMSAGRALFGRRRDGSEVPIEIGLNPIETPEGVCTLASIIDITERKQAEEQLGLVVEAAPNAMLMIDRRDRIALVNRKAVEMFGYDRDVLIGQPIELLVPERFRKRHSGFIRGYLAAPRARAMGAGSELFGRRADGSEFPIEIGLNPIETRDGKFTLASAIDISERKRAEAAQNRLGAIVESSDDAIVGKTLEGVITSWNTGAERLLGYTASEAVGQPISIVIPASLTEEEQSIMARLRRGERIEPFETLRKRKDGSEVDVSVRISPIRDSSGAILGGSTIMRDITTQKRRDAELQRSNAELEQFAYVASHDLQEPLRMVANYTELLAQRYEGQLDDKAQKYIHYAADGARRMQRLVADLLAYARVGSQGKPLKPVDVQESLRAVVRSLQTLMQDNNASVVYERLPVVNADDMQLAQLFQNLIGNAIKFRSEASPRIVIRAVPVAQGWQFSVTDNGIGMEMQHAERIFQMFQRLHELGKYPGSGIGLAIVKRIVERHGGRIWVESQPGSGTSFHFTLPAVHKVAS